MIRILLTGVTGQVGHELRRTLAPLGRVMATDRAAADLADADGLRRLVREARPALIVNAAAHTAVDRAESEPDVAMAVNAVAPGILAEEARRIDAALVHFSTDYVFDGNKDAPYTEGDAPAPLSVYGRTKLLGEGAIAATGARHVILRTSWVYGARGSNFLLTIRRLAGERESLRVVDDQVGAPTWSRMIAEATAAIVSAGLGAAGGRAADVGTPGSAGPAVGAGATAAVTGGVAGDTHAPGLFADTGGVYHLTAQGATTWCGFAREILNAAPALGLARIPRLCPIPTSEYPTPAVRPPNSVLAGDKLRRTFGIALPAWDDALRLCIEDLAR